MKNIAITFFAVIIVFVMFGQISFVQAAGTVKLSKSTTDANTSTDIAALQARVEELSIQLTELRKKFVMKDDTLWTRVRQAPTELAVGKQGTWQVRILNIDTTSPVGSTSTEPYYVQTSWGDSPVFRSLKLIPATNAEKKNELVFFTHTFDKPGTYKIQFATSQGARISVATTSVTVK